MSWLGDARTRFTLQEPSGLSGSGYADVVTVPGSKRLAGGNEVLKFGGQLAAGQYVVTIRFRDDVRADWRLVDDQEREYQIASYGDADGRRAYLTIYCQGLQ
jgi:SPP1 family predicted phage head-tail adaptor